MSSTSSRRRSEALIPTKRAASSRAVALRADALLDVSARSPGDIARFRRTVWDFYDKIGRHDLPWRKTRDPYKILVSEVMLQQTQVERVVPFYVRFIQRFPNAETLAGAPLRDVLAAWQGLGYNRRAKMLREAAGELSRMKLSADEPELVQKLESLPGVGPYTARAVAAFAFDIETAFIETNIRTVFIYYFFSDRQKVADKELNPMIAAAIPRGKSREWYWALMDYGAHLKRSGVRLNVRSASYAKQTKFEGSLRQVRGAILTALAAKRPLAESRQMYPAHFDAALAALAKDGLIARSGRSWRLAR